MSRESDFIEALRGIASDPGARGLADDAAVLEFGGSKLVLTHDMIAQGVHFLSSDPPQDVAWKLVAVNLSDLAAKGAAPVGILLGYGLTGDDAWDAGFVEGLRAAVATLGVPLLGGDTVSLPDGSSRAFGLTAVGAASGVVPARSGAQPGDLLWVTGTIGDGGAGLRVARSELPHEEQLLARYRRPQPRLEAGLRLAPMVSAMMDVSDGLLIDASRLASASGVAIAVDLAAVPLSQAFRQAVGEDREARLFASTAGDDYELMFTTPPALAAEVVALGEEVGLPVQRIGRVREGQGLSLADAGNAVPLPPRLGYEHGAPPA